MRVIIKPAGFLLLAAALIGLVVMLLTIREPKEPESAPRPAWANSGSGILQNIGFETPSASPAPVLKNTAKAHIQGAIAASWQDDSTRSECEVNYGLDTTNPHSGKWSQKIAVKSLHQGDMQFVQRVQLAHGKNCRAALWVRASEPNVPVKLALREADSPFTSYGEISGTAGTDWTKLEVSAVIGRDTPTCLSLTLQKGGIVAWVDDAELEVL